MLLRQMFLRSTNRKKDGKFVWLKQKWGDLFAADFEVLLYRRSFSATVKSVCSNSSMALSTYH